MARKLIPLFLLVSLPVFAAPDPLADAAHSLLDTPAAAEGLGGKRVAVICEGSPIHQVFGRYLEIEVGKIATVINVDNSIIEKEVNRQLSGLVGDEFIVGLGHEYGAEVVLQAVLYRLSEKGREVKVSYKAVDVRTNADRAHGITTLALPRGYDITALHVLTGLPSDPVKDAAMKFAARGVVKAGPAELYSAPPEKPKLQLPEVKLPEIEVPAISLPDKESLEVSTLGIAFMSAGGTGERIRLELLGFSLGITSATVSSGFDFGYGLGASLSPNVGLFGRLGAGFYGNDELTLSLAAGLDFVVYVYGEGNGLGLGLTTDLIVSLAQGPIPCVGIYLTWFTAGHTFGDR